MDFYKKCYPTFIGTYVFSYIGRLADHGYMNEIEDVSWTSAIRRIPMITMVEIGDEFSITFLQNFEISKYAEAIAKEMERLGITVNLLKKMGYRGHAPVEYKRYYGLPEPDFSDDFPEEEEDSFENRIKMKSLRSKIRTSREGDDLHCEVKVPIHKLVLGGTQRIPTIDGEEVQIKIAAGTQAGSVLRLREQGLYPLKKQGDINNPEQRCPGFLYYF